MHQPEHHHADHSLGIAARGRYWSAPLQERFWDQTDVFYKTRMRRLLRSIIAAAVPEGLRPARGTLAAHALMLERAAMAHGVTWHGLAPAQAALVIVLAARGPRGPASVGGDRLVAAAQAFAVGRGLGAFAAGIERDMRRIFSDPAPRQTNFRVV